MTNNIIHLSSIDSLIDTIDEMFSGILRQTTTREDAEVILDALENNIVIFIDEHSSLLPYERLKCFKKKIKKTLKKRRRGDE